jgi:hypothetical protein
LKIPDAEGSNFTNEVKPHPKHSLSWFYTKKKYKYHNPEAFKIVQNCLFYNSFVVSTDVPVLREAMFNVILNFHRWFGVSLTSESQPNVNTRVQPLFKK